MVRLVNASVVFRLPLLLKGHPATKCAVDMFHSFPSLSAENLDHGPSTSPLEIPGVVFRQKADTDRKLESAAFRRREYALQVSKLRKAYRAELEKEEKQQKKLDDESLSRISEGKEQRQILKQQRSQARAVEVEEESRILQARLKEERRKKAEHRNRVEGRQGHIRFKRNQEIRRQSSMWIYEKDLERRISEAMSYPYFLAGSYGSDTYRGGDSTFVEEEDDM